MHYENFIMILYSGSICSLTSFVLSFVFFHVTERTLRIELRIVRTCSVVHYYKNFVLAFFTML